jgi:hypothetical protein
MLKQKLRGRKNHLTDFIRSVTIAPPSYKSMSTHNAA